MTEREKKPTLEYGRPGPRKHRRRLRVVWILVVMVVLLIAEFLREWLLYGNWAILIGAVFIRD